MTLKGQNEKQIKGRRHQPGDRSDVDKYIAHVSKVAGIMELTCNMMTVDSRVLGRIVDLMKDEVKFLGPARESVRTTIKTARNANGRPAAADVEVFMLDVAEKWLKITARYYGTNKP
ncbi:hypothetical protein NM208_g17029 [Fusarium decemcellulare]|uniref:Uncharacterized protein n=1 Tax=Fusarium decemcellulare TaxID=57161 RepID=A0ACC1RB39_9HYPO|nr:hypothetical protein NM208_g17029 [Fusarium decemcellulare]